MSLDKIYVHVNSRRNKNGLVYTAVSRVTCPDGLLTTAFEGDLLDRIAKSKGMQRVRAEIARLGDFARETAIWVEQEGIYDMFAYYYNKKLYRKKKQVLVPVTGTRITTNTLSNAMDIQNYSADILGSEIADHTFAQDCAWRRRMHKANSRASDIEQILSMAPPPLGRLTTKKRKRRAKASHPTQKKRTKRSSKKHKRKRDTTD